MIRLTLLVLLSCSRDKSPCIQVTMYHDGDKIGVYTDVVSISKEIGCVTVDLRNGQRVSWNGDYLIERQ